MNPLGKPVVAGPAGGADDAPPGVREFCRLGSVGTPCLDEEKAFMRAMMSGFIWVVPARPAKVDAAAGGFPRAALSVPNGVDEGVMLETVAAEVMSELVRSGGGGDRLADALSNDASRGGDCESGVVPSGDSGGVRGDSRGDSGSSSGERAAMVVY